MVNEGRFFCSGVAVVIETVYIRPPRTAKREDQMPDRTGPISSRRRVVAGVGIAGLAMTTLTTTVLAQALAPVAGQGSATLSAERFTPYLNQNFLIWGGQVRLLLKLVEVNRFPRGRMPYKFPAPFSLVFRDLPHSNLGSGEYQVQDPDGKRTAMFLNPVTSAPLYEATFN
jgi:hypothetical protein